LQIGDYPYPFDGKFYGNYKVIRNIIIIGTPTHGDNMGLFGYTYRFNLKFQWGKNIEPFIIF
jgi:hypothetical protein